MMEEKGLKLMRETKFATGHFYHVYNRGVDRRKLFATDADYYRFIHDLYEFNDTKPASALSSYHARKEIERLKKEKDKNFGSPTSKIKEERVRLVDIVAFALMPNHFHLLLAQKKRSGITMFLRKLGTGYTNYFNKKHRRTGHLFEGKFKSIEVDKETYLLHLVSYIHLNPVKIIFPKWQSAPLGRRDRKKIISFLEGYRWSSLMDFLKKKNFPSLLNNEIILEILGKKRYRNVLLEALETDVTSYKEFTLED